MGNKIYPVILAGGSGTRLWPRSRTKYPKQFIPFIDGRSLFQLTCQRFANKNLFSSLTIITNEEYRFIVRDQLREINLEEVDIITEPKANNTAAACIYAASFIKTHKGDVPIIFTPADQIIRNEEYLFDAIEEALPAVNKGYLCLLAIQPTHPHTGYGYIIKGEHLEGNSYAVDTFTEKPPVELAERLIAQGASWNTGIYFCSAQTMLDEAKKFVPELHARAHSFIASLKKNSFGFHPIPLEEYDLAIPISIDKAVTEQTEKKIVIDAAIGWKDLGSWLSLYEEFEKDDNKNVLRGNTVALETSNSYVESTNRLVTTFGLEGVGIIETPDAVLVFPLERSEQVKDLVSKLSEGKRQELVVHTKVHRPWGEYEVLGKEEKFQVKKITVLPGAELSLQRHKRRAEHWVIVSGTATVTKEEEIIELHENESIYIPMNTIHKLENKTSMPISLIETQTGNYFGEDDIERLSDAYGRM